MNFAQTRKAWVAGLCLALLAGLDVALVELPLTPGQQSVVKIVAVVLGAIATYAVPNAAPRSAGIQTRPGRPPL